ncbi:MAG: 23S rRNA (guanosine(2251)-2'-O)-methyltransferase RlmB [Treponematales bacterium]
MVYLSGFHAIEERIRSGRPCGALLVAKPGPRAREIAALAVERKVRVNRVGTNDLDAAAPGHRGIALEVDEPGPAAATLEGFLAGLDGGGKRDALVVVMDEITDPHNFGAILRSCDQFAADLALTRRRRTARSAASVAQTSAGAASWVPCAETANLPRALEALKAAGFWIYGADREGKPAWDIDLTGRTALVFGGEGGGLSRLVRERCDGFAALPSLGRLDSLNVSVAAGALLYEVIRQRMSGK